MTSRPEWPLLIALAIGLLIGLERERRKGDGPGRASAGLRTFAVVGLMGGVAAAVGSPALILLVGAFVGLGALAGYALGDRGDPGMTGEVALMATYLLGVLAHSQPALAMEAGIVVTALLAFRAPLHRLVREWISETELRDGLIFAIAAAVILPMLPDRAIGPFGVLNPFTLWRLAVVAMALGTVGHLAQRLAGARYGLMIAGLASGLVSSTAAIVTMGGRSRARPDVAPAAAAGAVASLVGSLAYLSAVIGAVSPQLLRQLALPLGLAAAIILLYAAILTRGAARQVIDAPDTGRAFNGWAVLLFVALVGSFTLASDLLIYWLGASGAVAGAAAMGLADAHAAAVSMATLSSDGRLTAPVAALGVLAGLTANMAVKIPAAFMAGNRSYAIRVTIGVLVLLAGLWAGVAVTTRF